MVLCCDPLAIALTAAASARRAPYGAESWCRECYALLLADLKKAKIQEETIRARLPMRRSPSALT
jgi:hypothetical protein